MSLTEIQKDSINNKSDMDNIQHNYIFSTINSNNNSINLNHNTSMCNRVVGLNNDYYNTPSIIDINSELLNLNTPLNRDLYEYSSTKKYNYNKPIDTVEMYNKQYNKDISCDTVKNYNLNRWYNLYKNPLDNSIEPFNRIGENSVLNLLNSIENDDDEISKLVRGEIAKKASMGLIKEIPSVSGGIPNTVLNSGINKQICNQQHKLDTWFNPWLPII